MTIQINTPQELLNLRNSSGRITVHSDFVINCDINCGTAILIESIHVFGEIKANGEFTCFRKKIKCCGLTSSGSIHAGAKIEIKGDLKISGYFNWRGDLAIHGNAEIKGAFDGFGDLKVYGDLHAGGSMYNRGRTTINGNTRIEGDCFLMDSYTLPTAFHGHTTVRGDRCIFTDPIKSYGPTKLPESIYIRGVNKGWPEWVSEVINKESTWPSPTEAEQRKAKQKGIAA